MYTPEQADAVRAALAIGTGSTGLFAIPTLLDPSLILTGVKRQEPDPQVGSSCDGYGANVERRIGGGGYGVLDC